MKLMLNFGLRRINLTTFVLDNPKLSDVFDKSNNTLRSTEIIKKSIAKLQLISNSIINTIQIEKSWFLPQLSKFQGYISLYFL